MCEKNYQSQFVFQRMTLQHATKIHMQFGIGSFSLTIYSLCCRLFFILVLFYNLFICLLDWTNRNTRTRTFKKINEQRREAKKQWSKKNQVNTWQWHNVLWVKENKEDKIATNGKKESKKKKKWFDRLINDPDVKRFQNYFK